MASDKNRRNRPSLSLHVPEPEARPGDDDSAIEDLSNNA